MKDAGKSIEDKMDKVRENEKYKPRIMQNKKFGEKIDLLEDVNYKRNKFITNDKEFYEQR